MFSNVKQSTEPHRRFTFETHGIDLAVINGLRRVILTDIPVVAFAGEESVANAREGEGEDSLKILANNGPLHNEFLLHRFGLIPIHLSASEIDTFNSDDYMFELNVDNTSQNVINVTTKDFKVFKGDPPVAINPSTIFPADPFTKDHILITRLRPSEHIHVKGTATKGTAREHAGFTAVSLCTISFMSSTQSALGVLERERAFNKNKYGEPTDILFSIEAESALTPHYLVDKALSIIIGKVNNFSMSEAASIPERKDNGVEFTIKDEDDTLGNILQSQMHNKYIRENQLTAKNRKVTYVGYYCPHPLETSVVIKLCMEDHANVTDAEYIEMMYDSCGGIVVDLERIRDEWNNYKTSDSSN